LAKRLIPEVKSYSLGKLVKSLGIPLSDQHRAGGDARATLELFKLLIIKDKDSEIIQQQHKEINSKTYLNKVQHLTLDLPTKIGIIYFQNCDGKIIFFDFVNDLNKFSKSIFNSKSKRWKNIQQETERISYELTGNNILAKLMMKTKGLRKQENLQFGLFHQNEKYFVDKISAQKEQKPLLKFKSFTQGLKAVNFIQKNEKFANLQKFIKHIDLKERNEIWISGGRTLGEKSFLIFEKGNITSYGFYELHTQIISKDKIDKLKININTHVTDFENDLKLGLLQGDFIIIPLPK
jgi:DNA polymerase-3 subunit epsilon